MTDQLIIYAGSADGVTGCLVPHITEHVEANLLLIEEFLDAKTRINGDFLEIAQLALPEYVYDEFGKISWFLPQ